MIINTYLGSNSSNGLNFKVVGSLTQPENPTENTIWVNTDAEITSYVFSSTEPSPIEGMVWIKTGISSVAKFNAIKVNTLFIYPLSCMQYISGSWIEKEMKIYINGEWIGLSTNTGEDNNEESWDGLLFDHGDQCTEYTGGWEVGHSYGGSWVEGAYEYGGINQASINNLMVFQQVDNGLGEEGDTGQHRQPIFVSTKNKVNISGFNKLCIKISYGDTDLSTVEFGLGNGQGYYSSQKTLTSSQVTEGVHSLNISGSGSYYIQISAAYADIGITEVWLE